MANDSAVLVVAMLLLGALIFFGVRRLNSADSNERKSLREASDPEAPQPPTRSKAARAAGSDSAAVTDDEREQLDHAVEDFPVPERWLATKWFVLPKGRRKVGPIECSDLLEGIACERFGPAPQIRAYRESQWCEWDSLAGVYPGLLPEHRERRDSDEGGSDSPVVPRGASQETVSEPADHYAEDAQALAELFAADGFNAAIVPDEPRATDVWIGDCHYRVEFSSERGSSDLMVERFDADGAVLELDFEVGPRSLLRDSYVVQMARNVYDGDEPSVSSRVAATAQATRRIVSKADLHSCLGDLDSLLIELARWVKGGDRRMVRDSPQRAGIVEIGWALNHLGADEEQSFRFMQQIADSRPPEHTRYLNSAWNGIGKWLA